MTVEFACSETSGMYPSAAYAEVTSGFNASLSRACLGVSGSSQTRTYTSAKLTSPVAEGRIRWFRRGNSYGTSSVTNFGTKMTLYTSAGVGILRVRSVSTSTPETNGLRLDYWNGTTWVECLSFPYRVGTLNYYEIAFKTGVGGTATVFVDDTIIGTASIGDATGALSYFDYTVRSRSSSSTLNSVSEFIVSDNERTLTGCIVETEGPTANGTDVGGTGSYADVDEATSDAGATVLSLGDGEKQSFVAAARTGTAASDSILAVTVAADMKRDVTGPNQARFYLLIGATRYYGEWLNLTEGYAAYQHSWPLNPATSANWTAAAAESAALEWGIEARVAP